MKELIMNKRVSISWILASTAMTLTGCVADATSSEETGEESVAEVAEAINGSVTFPDGSCSATAKGNILLAMTKVVEKLYTFPAALNACVASSVLSPDNRTSPEEALRRLRENMPTKMTCADGSGYHCGNIVGWDVCPEGDAQNEEIKWDTAFAEAGDTTAMASLLLAMVAYEKGYDVLPGIEFGFSVPEQIRSCVLNGNPGSGPRRESVPFEVELGRLGAYGGNPFEIACPEGMFVDEVGVQTGDTVKLLRITCSVPSDQFGSFQTFDAGSTAGATSSASSFCPAGVMTGLFGRTGGMIDQLGATCSTFSSVQAGTPNSQDQLLGGGQGGVPFRRTCPAGMAIKRILGRAGAAIDEIRVVCQDVDEERNNVRKNNPVGGTIGFLEDDRCMGFGAMIGLYGRSGAELDRIGGVCRPRRS
jgi:hypothetical protein